MANFPEGLPAGATERGTTLVDGLGFSFVRYPKCAPMKATDQIPFYAADGRSLGFRTLEAAERLVAGEYVKASYGRKKQLRAIWLCQEDGGNPVETRAQAGMPSNHGGGLNDV
jgi:hypothetical protein